MSQLELSILYYIIKNNNENENDFISTLGTELKDNNSYRIIFNKNNYNIIDLQVCPILKLWLEQYNDKLNITIEKIHDSLYSLLDSDYIERSNYDNFSFRLTNKGLLHYNNSELKRNIKQKKIGF